MLRTLLIGALLVGCADPPAAEQDAGPGPDAATVERAFTLEVAYDDGVSTPSGPLRLLAEPLHGPGQLILDLDLDPGAGGEGHSSFTVDGLDAGQWRLTAFVDRADDGRFDACPYPPQPSDPLEADGLDNHHGQWQGTLGAGSTVTVTVERHLCGPGDISTGLTGTLSLPAGVEAIEAPLLLELAPVGEGPTLQLPLFPAGLSAQRTRFSIGELLPGPYRLTVYADDDGDGRPSPCGAPLGGGDRVVVRYPEGGGGLVLEAGRRLAVDLALALVDGCPEALTGLSLSVALDAELEAALALDPTLDDATGVLAGPVWIGLIPPTGGSPVLAQPLFSRVGELPSVRWATGLDPGPWVVAAWVDRDADGRFGPCGGLAGGLDAVIARSDIVQVGAGRVRDLALVLRQGDCDLDLGGLQGELRVPVEAGPVGSGRPVRLDLVDADGGDRLGVQLFENHWRMPVSEGPERAGRFALTAELPPGAYHGVAYLDTDGDGRFTPCDPETGFGDRTSSLDPAVESDDPGVQIQIAPGQLADLGTVTMRERTCPIPDTTVELTIEAGMGPQEPPAPLRLRIDELGGWHEDLRIAAAFEPVEGVRFSVPRRALPPGRYRLTAYLDTDGDEAFADCEAPEFDGWAGRVEIELGRDSPTSASTVRLQPACGR